MPHTCHATGCTAKVPPEMFMCKRHWMSLPKRMRDAIWSTYRQGQCDDWEISHAYANAAREAVKFIAQREGVEADVSVYDMLDPKRYQENEMAGQTTQNSLFANAGGALAKSTAAHKDDKPDYGNQGLPAGVTGVAKLRKLELGVYGPDTKLSGKPYFMADAVVVHPLDFKDGEGMLHKTAGQYTRIGPEPLFDTPEKTGEKARKTFDQHWGWMMNELRILNNGNLPDLNAGIVQGMDGKQQDAIIEKNLKAFMKALLNAKPPIFTKFKTFSFAKQKPRQQGAVWFLGPRMGPYPSLEALKNANPHYDKEPLVFHDWLGSTAWDVPSPNGAAAPSMGVGVTASPSVTATVHVTTPTQVNPAPVPVKVMEDGGEALSTFDDGAEESLESLANRCATDSSTDAGSPRDTLLKKCEAVGITKEQFEAFDKWEEIPEAIRNATSSTEDSEEGEQEEGTPEGEAEGTPEGEPEQPESKPDPEKGNVYLFLPKGKRKPVKCEVRTVNKSLKTVTLFDPESKLVFKEIGWDRLES